MTISPLLIPTLIIEVPSTLSVNTSFLFGIKYAGNVKNSSGISIASIGVPAVTVPSSGTSITSFSSYSFSTNNSIALFFESPFLIYFFCSKIFKWLCTVAGDESPRALPISLTVGGYPFLAILFFK